MANINQTITLGIGTPASILYFITVGLGIGAAEALQVYTVSLDAQPSPVLSLFANISPAAELEVQLSADEEVEIG